MENEAEEGVEGERYLLAHFLQVLQDTNLGIHPPVNTVLCAGLFGLAEGVGRDLGGDAFLPAHVVELVDHCTH